MSIRSRARRLQHAAGLGFQEARAKLIALADAPSLLRERSGWPLARCDLYCFDPRLDEEWQSVHEGSTRAEEGSCEICHHLYFLGDAERLRAEARCPACRVPVVESRSSVIELVPATQPDFIREVCEQALAVSQAKGVVFVSPNAAPVAVGAIDRGRLMLMTRRTPTHRLHKLIELRASEIFAIAREDHAHVERVGDYGVLVFVYDDKSSLGMVRLAARKAAEQLVRVMEGQKTRGTPFVPPAMGGSGSSGAPAEAFAGVAKWTPGKPTPSRLPN